jgi:hypothetical protein
MPEPPPMQFVSRDERSQLNSSKDPKSRLKTTISLAEVHLTRAETLTQDQKFDQASEELGNYLGLIGDVSSFIHGMNVEKSSTRDLFRHMEQSVRLHLPRLAVMRRGTPAQYAGNIRTAEEFVKGVREEALDSFFGHTVLREPTPIESKAESQKGSTDGPKRP